ncbi:hypothetical protein [Sinorhizobium fredii]|uniref:hypothetical protein n=1 Tax=Rhizobium fredii TaxID=380 RepID=UPI001FCB2A36|nr:hypothetical protein [Sinorhizobium fredii]
MHAPILAAYLGSDPVAASSLSDMANPLRHVDIVDHRFLRPGRSAQILIVDCREPKLSEQSLGKLSPEMMQLALVSENGLYRKAIFASGYSDYLLWPLIEQEVLSRLAACIARIERGSAGLFFSADPLVQKSCDLLAQRVDRQTALSELARMVGTDDTRQPLRGILWLRADDLAAPLPDGRGGEALAQRTRKRRRGRGITGLRKQQQFLDGVQGHPGAVAAALSQNGIAQRKACLTQRWRPVQPDIQPMRAYGLSNTLTGLRPCGSRSNVQISQQEDKHVERIRSECPGT